MAPLPLNSETLQEQLGELLAELALPADDAGAAPSGDSVAILAAFGRLIDVMQRLEKDYRQAAPARCTELAGDATELGEFAFQLLDKAEHAVPVITPEHLTQYAALAIGFAYWVARHGGIVRDLVPLVDHMALLANRTQSPELLADLATVMLTLIDTAAASHVPDLDNANPGRPWRLLHLNLGIVATRSQRPDLMELAFARLVTHLPEDAAQFFHHGMQQVERIDYPEPVRTLMQDYFAHWGGKPALH